MKGQHSMNILLMTNTMKQPDDTYSSKTDVVFFFAKEWVRAGHRVVIIHSETKFPLMYYWIPKPIVTKIIGGRFSSFPSVASRKKLKREQDGVSIYRLPMLKLIPHSSYSEAQYKKQLKLIQEYFEEINFKPDVITGHWLEPQLKLIHELGEKYKAKTGFVIHGMLPDNLNNTYKEYIKGLNCFFLRSQSVKDQTLASQQKAFMPNKVSVCYSGIPDEYVGSIVKRSDWKKDGLFRVIYVGRLVGYKRLDALIQALAEYLKDVNYRLELIGEGDEKEALMLQAQVLGISERVVFHGRVPRDEVQNKLRQADCFVMISENEVFGLAYLEAMAAGCITVASIGGGVDGIIESGKNGYLSEQGDSEKLGVLLNRINTLSLEDVAKIRENAEETVRAFTDSKVAERYLQDIVNG